MCETIFFDKPSNILYKFALSYYDWYKRISVLDTFMFIRNNEFKDALKISKILLRDYFDLIHKAVGWMLREIGNRDKQVEKKFLKKHVKKCHVLCYDML